MPDAESSQLNNHGVTFWLFAAVWGAVLIGAGTTGAMIAHDVIGDQSPLLIDVLVTSVAGFAYAWGATRVFGIALKNAFEGLQAAQEVDADGE